MHAITKTPKPNSPRYIIGIDEAGRAARTTSDPRPVFIIGIDEAGRGPLAGPLVVAGIKMRADHKAEIRKFLRGIKDSKKLSARQREAWFLKLTVHLGLQWAVSYVSPAKIDRINIARASNLGAHRAYLRLVARRGGAHALLDGGLSLPRHISQETIIKGDEKVPLISAASIIAKVWRDRIMRRIHNKFPEYGFDAHKGYPTRLHRERIMVYGLRKVHRRSFLKKLFAESRIV